MKKMLIFYRLIIITMDNATNIIGLLARNDSFILNFSPLNYLHEEYN